MSRSGQQWRLWGARAGVATDAHEGPQWVGTGHLPFVLQTPARGERSRPRMGRRGTSCPSSGNGAVALSPSIAGSRDLIDGGSRPKGFGNFALTVSPPVPCQGQDCWLDAGQ